MPTNDNSMVDRARTMAGRLTPMQKIALGAVVITVVAGGLMMSRSSSTTAMAPLFTDMASADASSVVDELNTRGVAYDLTDAGRTVMVPKDQVYNLRVEMAGQGLPASNEGYALLDNQGITTSEFRQRVDYQRAMEGEIAKTIEALDGVNSASVHLALPDDSVFVEDTATPTASVLVAGNGVGGISGSEVEAIVHLVASSVKGMKPGDVTVVDSNGTVLSGTAADGSSISGGTSERAKAVSEYEARMEASLMALLTKTTGPNKAAVKVTADLDLDSSTATSETFTPVLDGPDGNPIVSVDKSSSERYGAEVNADDGTSVLGPDGATVDGSATQVGTGGYVKIDNNRQYVLDRTVEQVVAVPGKVNKLAVSVLVDDQAVTAEQVPQIEAMMNAAIGSDPTVAGGAAGTVTVTRLPFDASTTEQATELVEAQAAAASKAQMMDIARTVAILLVIVIALFLGYRSAKNARRVTAIPIQLGELTAATPRPLAGGSQQALPASEPTAADMAAMQMNRTNERDDMVMNELTMMADRRPEEVADVLRTWLTESKGRR
jgi:flagellar M-ring protein FliF